MILDYIAIMLATFFVFLLCIAPCYFLLRDAIHHLFKACFLPDEYDKIYANMTFREKLTLDIDTRHLKRERQFHDDYGNLFLLKRILVILVVCAMVLCAVALLLKSPVFFEVVLFGTIILTIPFYILIFARRDTGYKDWVWIYDTQRSRKTSKKK